MVAFTRVVTAIAVLLTGAVPLAADHSHVALVPWQVLEIGARVDAPLALYWIPASAEELRRSPLLLSRDLTFFSARCVAMRVVRVNDRARLTSLGVEERVPAVVLADDEGNVLGRVDAIKGVLSLSAVEDLVRDALRQREADAEARLDLARRRSADDRTAAIALYRQVWEEERCLCPRQARDARRALRKLGRR